MKIRVECFEVTETESGFSSMFTLDEPLRYMTLPLKAEVGVLYDIEIIVKEVE